MLLAQARLHLEVHDQQFIESQEPCRMQTPRNPVHLTLEGIEIEQSSTKAYHAPGGCAPICEPSGVVNEPAQCLLHLIECANHHHQLPKGQVSREIGRRGNDNGDDESNPAVACRDKCEADRGHDNLLQGCQHMLKLGLYQPSRLILTTA